ncbi:MULTISPECIES: acyl-CoA carboxylase subunit epsilon [unclassified Streptomyces]|uniref:acyl-CoA carboxylase subunit epsilon n=1 Tax=Streptomyces sp. NPDC046915 TaxID=3155257 RepID=UPI0033C69F27
MGDTDREEPALRVERGRASDEELAALTVVLLALSGRAADEDQDRRPVNGSRWWRRPENYRGSRSWQ